MSTLPNTLRNDWGVAGNFSYCSSSRRALFPGTDSSAMNGSKKRPRVEKISSSRYRAYQGMRELIWGMRELILGYAGIDPGDCRRCGRHCDAIVIRGWFIFWNSQDGVHRSRVRNEQIHLLMLRTSPSFGRLNYFFEDCDLEALVSQANRKRLRCTVHPDLNRLSTAGRLWCADVAPRVSIDCYRPVAAAGRRAGCAGS